MIRVSFKVNSPFTHFHFMWQTGISRSFDVFPQRIGRHGWERWLFSAVQSDTEGHGGQGGQDYSEEGRGT